LAPLPPSYQAPINCIAQAAIDARQPHPDKKKIFVFCDGTGNEFAQTRDQPNANSNVVKLYTTVRVTNKQVAYYHPGVGTMGNPAIQNRVLRFWSKVKGLAFGAGFRDNVLDAYRYLMETYNDGDEIYLFGFSRGSYTARALGGMLHGYGLLCRGNEGHLLYAWKMFVEEVEKSREELKKNRHDRKSPDEAHSITRNFAFAQTYSRDVTIRFMGLWDTVSSVGWIYKPIRLLDMARNPILQVGRHAVSIDERRAFYRDNLWGDPYAIDDPDWPKVLRDQGIAQDLAQVWFPGAHSDVGGSYPQQQTAPANEALRWMIGELQRNGAELCEERVAMVLGEKPAGLAADHIYLPPPPENHRLHDSLTLPWLLLQGFPQQYYDKDDKKIQWRVPYGTPRSIPDGAFIHGSAIKRLRGPVANDKPYHPLNLRLDQLHPLQSQPPGTTANLDGCFVFRRNHEPASAGKTAARMIRLFFGWISFGIFMLLFAAFAWYTVSFAVLLILTLITHTPGLRKLFHLRHWRHWRRLRFRT
jgi:uncharacterized protein (DUF2235 family)